MSTMTTSFASSSSIIVGQRPGRGFLSPLPCTTGNPLVEGLRLPSYAPGGRISHVLDVWFLLVVTAFWVSILGFSSLSGVLGLLLIVGRLWVLFSLGSGLSVQDRLEPLLMHRHFTATGVLLAAICISVNRLALGDFSINALVKPSMAVNAVSPSYLALRLDGSRFAATYPTKTGRQDTEVQVERPSGFVRQLHSAHVDAASMALEVAAITRELDAKDNELAAKTNALGALLHEVEEYRLLAQPAGRETAETLEALVQDLRDQLDAAQATVRDKDQEIEKLELSLTWARKNEARARAGAARTAKSLTVLQKDMLAVSATATSSQAQVASLVAQLLQKEQQIACAERKTDEVQERMQRRIYAVCKKANAEVERLASSLTIRQAEIEGLRWELQVRTSEVEDIKERLDAFPPQFATAIALDWEKVDHVPALNLPAIIFESPSSQWAYEVRDTVDQSYLYAPGRNDCLKSTGMDIKLSPSSAPHSLPSPQISEPSPPIASTSTPRSQALPPLAVSRPSLQINNDAPSQDKSAYGPILKTNSVLSWGPARSLSVRIRRGALGGVSNSGASRSRFRSRT